MIEDLRKIIKFGTYAPSGDNTQPWSFCIKDNIISVFSVSKKDTSLYNFGNMASLIAVGAVLENMKIAAANLGYASVVKILVNSNEHVADIILTKDNSMYEDDLFPFIKERRTNRKKYSKKIPAEMISSMLNIKKEEGVHIKINTDSVKDIAAAASKNEKIVLESKSLHDFLFTHITWTDDEDIIKKGFFIKTLELNIFQNIVFKIFRNWNILKFFNMFGIANLVSKDNQKLYESSGAIISFVIENMSNEYIVNLGMLMERVWLTATKYNLGVQPLTGITLLKNGALKHMPDKFSSKHRSIIKQEYDMIRDIFEVEKGEILVMLRIGIAPKPTAITRREEPLINMVN